MFRLIKQVFIGLLSFSRSSAAKFMPLNNERCVTRPTLIDLNPVKFNYYPFMVSLDKFDWNSNNAADDLSAKVCVPSKKKGVNVKVFNMITGINGAKTFVKHLSCDSKCKFDSKACNSNPKWNNERCQYECKNYQTCEEEYSWNPSASIWENGKYLKSVADDSKIVFDEIMNVTIVHQQQY